MQNNSASASSVPGTLLGCFVLVIGLFFSHGLYNLYWLWTLPTSLALVAFAPSFNLRNAERWIPFLFFILMSASITRGWGQIGNLQSSEPDREWLVSLTQAFFIFAAVASLACLRAKTEKAKSWLFFFTVALVSFGFVFLTFASPRPWIDVWSNQESATSLLLSGKNPYSTEYLNIYPLELQKTLNPFGNPFVYLPGVLYLLTPIKWLGLDTRIALIIAFVLSAFFIGSIRKKNGDRNYLAALFFVSFPFNPYLIDQAWNDTLTTVFIALAALAMSRNSEKVFLISLVGMTLIKPHILIVLPLLIFFGSRALQVGVGRMTIRWAFFFLLGCSPFIVWNAHDFFHSLWGFNAIARNSSDLFPDRIDGFSLLNWLTLTCGLRPRIAFTFVGVIAVGVGFWRPLRQSLANPTSLLAYSACVLILVFSVAPLAFINYYQICLGLLICAYALDRADQPLFRSILIDGLVFIASRSLLLLSTPLFHSSTTFYKFFASEKIGSFVPIQNFGYRLMPLAKLPMWFAQLFTSTAQANPLLAYRTAFNATALAADLLFFVYARKKFARANVVFYLLASTLLFDQFFDHVELFAGLLLAFNLVIQKSSWITTTLTFATQWTSGLVALVTRPRRLASLTAVLVASIAIATLSNFSVLDFFVRAIAEANAESIWNLLPKDALQGARNEVALVGIAVVSLVNYWYTRRISTKFLIFTVLVFDPVAGTAALVLALPTLALTANLRNWIASGLLASTCLLRTLEFHDVIARIGSSQIALLLSYVAMIFGDHLAQCQLKDKTNDQPPDFNASTAFSK